MKFKFTLMAFFAVALLAGASFVAAQTQDVMPGDNDSGGGDGGGRTPVSNAPIAQDPAPIGFGLDPRTGKTIEKLGKAVLLVSIKNNGKATLRGLAGDVLQTGNGDGVLFLDTLACRWRIEVGPSTKLYRANQSGRANRPPERPPIGDFVDNGDLITALGTVSDQTCTLQANVVRNHTKIAP